MQPTRERARLPASAAPTSAAPTSAAPTATVSKHGVLRARAAEGAFELIRLPPADDLAFFVERHWIVRWDLTDRAPYPQETLPQPCVNLVFEPGRAAVHGIPMRRFAVILEGKGQVFGTKFKPGAFQPFFGASIAALTDRALPLHEAFRAPEPLALDAAAALERAVAAEPDALARAALVEAFLRARLPPPDASVALVVRIVETALHDRTLVSAAQLADRAGLPARTLQRLFRRHVGVGPKWVIQRFRLHEAVVRAEEGSPVEWAALANDLGYFDQAHFIRDFKAHVGCSPAEHAAGCAR